MAYTRLQTLRVRPNLQGHHTPLPTSPQEPSPKANFGVMLVIVSQVANLASDSGPLLCREEPQHLGDEKKCNPWEGDMQSLVGLESQV